MIEMRINAMKCDLKLLVFLHMFFSNHIHYNEMYHLLNLKYFLVYLNMKIKNKNKYFLSLQLHTFQPAKQQTHKTPLSINSFVLNDSLHFLVTYSLIIQHYLS